MPDPFRPVQGDVLSTKDRRLVSVADRYLNGARDYHLCLQQGKPTTTQPNEAKKGFAQEEIGLLEELLKKSRLPENIGLAVDEFQTFLVYSTSERCDWEKFEILELITDKYRVIKETLLNSIGKRQEKKTYKEREADEPEGGGSIGTLEK